MSLSITGLGTATPRFSISQQDACELTYEFNCDTPQQRRLMSVIYRHSGVREKGSVLLQAAAGTLAEREGFFPLRRDSEDRGPGTASRMDRYAEEALPLALHASQLALQDAGVSPAKITHLVTVSCSGFNAPGFDIGLVRALGMDAGTPRTHVGFMGCHGVFNGLRVANAFTSAEPNAVVLTCSVELCSLHHFYGWHPERVIANGLFSDAAGAAVCRADDEYNNLPFRLVGQASTIVPETSDAMSWRIGDHGFDISLSPDVPRLIEENLAAWLQEFLTTSGHSIASVGAWAIHPGGPRILDACRDTLALREEQLLDAREILAQHGNMSSATILFLLERMRRENRARPVLTLGFGPGLTIETMLFN
jgi:predicted naringenin-chalcone synthase